MTILQKLLMIEQMENRNRERLLRAGLLHRGGKPMYLELDDKLFELQRACSLYRETDPLADWVLHAVSRHISTGRSTAAFNQAFLRYPAERFPELIRVCLNGDRSDDGIMKTVKRVLGREAA